MLVGRVPCVRIDAARRASDVMDQLAGAGVVAAKVYTIADIASDPVYRERGDIVRVADDDFGSLAMQAVIPHFAEYPGVVWRTGPKLGEDNALVFGEYLGLGTESDGCDAAVDG